jgi:hypothetical protein
MSEQNKQGGSCLCGAVKISAQNLSRHVGACHCGMCRKWGGGPFMTAFCGTEIVFDSEDAIEVYQSSTWAERGFCKQCGSHLFYRISASQQYMVPIGLFDDPDELVFERQVFIDRKPVFYSFSENTNNMTEAEVFERYGSS